jgi:DNA-binding NarL/FixJ family response regulator
VALRCLIIDDNAGFVAVARDLLEREGFAVVGDAANGFEALRQARELRPDVTLLDIDLGGESGFDVVRELVEDAGGAPSKVILISTHAEADYAELIEASPAAGFVAKTDLSSDSILAVLRGAA